MIYKEYQQERLSALGLGAMRLPTAPDGTIDKQAAAEMVAYAMKNGINYYDTAWGYHSGQSEPVMGEILSAYPRESFYLASKFPGYDLANIPKVAEIFEQQLKRCRVEYFDFYMFHNVCEANLEAYLDPANGIFDYLMEQKRKGRIRHLGCSTHASLEGMRRFLDAYGRDMEFCQIQLNYLDWTFQQAKEKVEMLKEYNVPVWVMEPLRGGKLANLGEAQAAALQAVRNESVPAVAFRFLQAIPTVTVTLSGMSNMAQLQENITVFSEHKPLNGVEFDGVLAVADEMRKTFLPCTSCRYCTEYCPQELDIPALLKRYNEYAFTGAAISPAVLQKFPAEKQPSACLGCHSCEAVCPQNIKIADVMADFAGRVQKA